MLIHSWRGKNAPFELKAMESLDLGRPLQNTTLKVSTVTLTLPIY